MNSGSVLAQGAQWLVVAIILAGCAVYAAWQLAPKALRRRCAQRLVQAVPGCATWSPVRTALRAPTAGGCNCNGCDSGSALWVGRLQRVNAR